MGGAAKHETLPTSIPLGQDGAINDASSVGAVQVHEPLKEHVPSRGVRSPQPATAIAARYQMGMLASVKSDRCPYRMAETVTLPQAPVRYPARSPVVERDRSPNP